MTALYAIIRIRGIPDTPPDVEHTLKLLRLHRKYHAVLYPDTLPGIREMLRKAQGWITWGEIDEETLIELLKKRGRAPGNKKLDEKYLEEKLGVKSFSELAKKLLSGEIMLHKLEDKIKPVFRLHPPKGGFKGSIKKMYGNDGELGYRGKAINDLLKRMI